MEKFARRLLYLSLTLLFIGIFATFAVPSYSAERVVGYIVIFVNVLLSVSITLYLRQQFKKEENAKGAASKNRVLGFIEKKVGEIKQQ